MSKVKIMIVDDSPLIIDVVGTVLRGAGYEVVTRSVAVGASAAILRERPALVLIDVSMPLVTGTEISQSLRGSRSSHESVIVLHSDRPAEQLDALVKECGADGYVRKTGNPRELLAEVSRWLAYGARKARGRGAGVFVAASIATQALVREVIGTRATVQATDSGTEALRVLYARDALRSVVIGSALRDLSASTLWRKALEVDPRLRGRMVVIDEGGRDERVWPADVVWWTRADRPDRLLEALALEGAEG
ncbi:response regulator [Sandaracinus amylolyticus]|uniref:response regulator n=1 Tax=Sandaracinus amylolyticus TaxID=927083 RepID=UPI001F0164A7|nr:response regulator [Sandaracinus amylolyticus]UJR80100.1 Two component transcriptional regulator, winged helix family [Sandaracinus amylolyticus]